MAHCMFVIMIQFIRENNMPAQIFCFAFDMNTQDYVFAIN